MMQNLTKNILYKLKNKLKVDKDIDLSNLMGVNRTTFSSWKNRDAIDYNILIDFCKKNNISLDWLFELNTNNVVNEPKTEYNSEEISELDEIKNRLKIIENTLSNIIKE